MTKVFPQLLNFGIAGSFYFAIYHMLKETIITVNHQDKNSKENFIPINQVFLTGTLTGAVNSIIQTPSDLLQICKQKNCSPKSRSIKDLGKEIYSKFGLRGLYLGFYSTFLRQALAGGIYFSTYEYIMRLFSPKGLSSRHSPIIAAFIAGGFAGMNSWMFTYPIDYVKTLIQSQDLGKLTYSSSLQCAYHRYSVEGYRTFYKGIGITMLRSFPINGCAFLGYELIVRSVV